MSDGLARAIAHKGDPTRTMDVIRIPNPNVGVDFTHTFTGAFVRRIIAVAARLTTSAVVANRQIRLDVGTPEGRVLTVPMVAPATASLVTELSWAEGITPPNTALFDGCLVAGFPDLIVPPGWSLTSVTSAIDVGDQYSNVFVVAEAFEALDWTHWHEKVNAWRGADVVAALGPQEG